MATKFQFVQSDLGGGGAIYGLIQDPTAPDTLYAKCDVAGVFKTIDGGKTWRVINRGATKAHHHQVQTICLNPSNPKILLRGTGEVRDNKIIGTLFKSKDSGETWYSVSEQIGFFGNGPNRYSEVAAFHPSDPKFAVCAGFLDGVFTSQDEGETWQYSGLAGEPVACVTFHPAHPEHIYASTYLDRKVNDSDQATRKRQGCLYVSKDRGKTWQLLYTESEQSISHVTFSNSDPDALYILTCDTCLDWPRSKGGIKRSVDGGSSFQECMEGLPLLNTSYGAFSADPNTPGVYYTSGKRYPDERKYMDQSHIPKVPLYKSVDECKTWQPLKSYTKADFINYPGYMKHEGWTGYDISRFQVDLKNPNRLFMTNWYGVSVSEDGGQTWNGNFFRGIETTCIENVTADPTIPGKAYLVMPDHYPMFTTDYGLTYRQFRDDSIFHNSTAIIASMHNPDVIIYSAKSTWMGHTVTINQSHDGGKTFQRVHTFENFLTVQAIREDYFNQGVFYAYVDRELAKGAGLYKSLDWGNTWYRTNLQLHSHIKRLPHCEDWIENEVLTVTRGQKKNVCGTNQLLCVDPHQKDTLYFGEWTEGLFRTVNGGKNWTDISPGLPFKVDKASILVDIKAPVQQPGVLYAGFIREGLWRSLDRGDSWEKVFPLGNTQANASSFVIGRDSGQDIFIASEPLYWSPCESAVWHSSDSGQSWSNIYNGEFGALRFKGIAIDNASGRLYLATCGNGAYYAASH